MHVFSYIKLYFLKYYYKILQLKEKSIVLSTIPINTFNAITHEIAGYAGGFILDYKNKHIVITAAHVIKEPRLIGINLEIYQGKPNIVFYKPYPILSMKLKPNLPSPDKLGKFKNLEDIFEKSSNECDLVYAQIPNNITPKEIDINSPFANELKRIIPITFPIKISPKEKYKFYGLRHVENTNGMQFFEPIFRNDLSIVRQDSYYIYFKTKQTFKNKISGCSGTPILDKEGNIISMIVAQHENYIKGLNLGLLEAIFFAAYDCEV